jgi:flavin-dependent dehydrogenase
MEGTTKKDGKVTGSSRIVIAADGKSRTVTTNLTDPAGKKMHSVAFYDKQ